MKISKTKAAQTLLADAATGKVRLMAFLMSNSFLSGSVDLGSFPNRPIREDSAAHEGQNFTPCQAAAFLEQHRPLLRCLT